MSPIPDARPLRPEERRLIEWLLEHGTPSVAAYAAQLGFTTVVSRCACGCPTIDLAVDGRAAALSSGSLILADVMGVTPEGVRVAVILHSREGLLSELEIISAAGYEGKFSVPRIEDMELPDA